MSFIVVRTYTADQPPSVTYMKLHSDGSGNVDWVTDVNQASRSATQVAAANSAKLHTEALSSPATIVTVQEIPDTYTVGTLPAPTLQLRGTRLFVSDQQSGGQVGAKLNGGGFLFCPCYCDGQQWLQG